MTAQMPFSEIFLQEQSNNIGGIRYWSDEGRLRIWFRSGHVYDYFQMTDLRWRNFINAKDKNFFFQRFIKFAHPYQLIHKGSAIKSYDEVYAAMEQEYNE